MILCHPGNLSISTKNHRKIKNMYIFKASALWANAFCKLKCPCVCLSVRLSVCVFTFEVPFKRLFAPTSQSRMSNIFRDSESLGKSNWKNWSHIWTSFLGFCVLGDFFCFSKKWGFLVFLVHQETTLPNGLETSGRRAYRYFFCMFLEVFEFLRFGWFFPFFKKIGFWGILCPTKHGGNHTSWWIRDLWSKGVLLILAYF